MAVSRTSGLRRFILVLFIGLLALFLQGSVMHFSFPGIPVPNFLLMLVTYLAFYEVSMLGVFLAFMLGLEWDLYSGVLLGPWAGAFVIVYAFVSIMARRVFLDSAPVIALAVSLSSLVSSMLYVVLAFQSASLFSTSWARWLLEAGMSGILAPIAFALFRRMIGVHAPAVPSMVEA